jgi:hypothetical protein
VSVLSQLLALGHRPLPPDEERDVNGEMFRTLFTGIQRSDFIGNDEMQHWLSELHQHDYQFQKAVRFETALKPLGVSGRASPGHHQSFLYAKELGVLGQTTADPWMEKPTPSGAFDFLAYMHENLDIHQALVSARCHQAEPFCRPYNDEDDNPLGYRWTRRDGERLNDADIRNTRSLDNILAMCGTERDPNKAQWKYRRQPFDSFVHQMIADSLVADSCPVELVHGGDGRLLGWHNLDYRTIRLAYEDGYLGDDAIVAVQINPETRGAVLGYHADDFLFPVRNPRSSVYYGDYGRSELESFTRAATAYLNSFTFNAAQQDRNSIPRGFLTLYGRFDQRALNSFRDQWNQLVRGAARRWALPVLVSESRQEGGAMYTPVDTMISEMYLTKWITFLVSLMCALYGMDPVELAMEAFTSKQSSLSGKDTSEKLQSSHDRGFIPLMLWLQAQLNTRLVSQYTSKYAIGWVGLFPADLEARQERQKLVLTVNEMRELDGVDEHPDPDIGAAPVNPVHMSVFSLKLQQRMMAEQQAQMGGMEHGGLPDSDSPMSDFYDERAEQKPGQPKPGGPPQIGMKPGMPMLPSPQPKLGLPAPAGGQSSGPAQPAGPKVGASPSPFGAPKPKPPMQKAGVLAVTITRLG